MPHLVQHAACGGRVLELHHLLVVAEAEGAERRRLWDLATGFYPGFARYQERAGDRRIPVIVCSPRD